LRKKPAKPLANNSAKPATQPSDDREGFTLPEDMANTNLAEDHDMGQRALDRVLDEVRQLKRGLSASTQNAGGYLVGVDLMTGSIIGLLRNKTLVSSMGIVNLDGLVNNVAIPRVTGGGTVYWLPEAARSRPANRHSASSRFPRIAWAQTHFTPSNS
jgi:hypothetical protein